MNNMTTFYATDRDLFDAMTSKRKKITTDLLFELCLDRGIIISKNEAREDIIEYLSTLPHDYNDFDYLMKLIAAGSRSEKTTSDEIGVAISGPDIKTIVNSVAADRTSHGESYTVVVESKERTVVKVEYTEMDYSLTRLRQRSQKEAYIEIVNENGETKFRRPANERTDGIVEDIIQKVQAMPQYKAERKSVNLEGIIDPELKSRFFTDLISKMPSLAFDDVTYIKVDRIRDTSSDDEEEEDEEENERVAQQMLGQVKKVSLEGGGLLYSPEYQHLATQGFFISKVIWRAIDKMADQIKIEFEASFANPQEGKDFRYNAKCFFKVKDGKYSNTRNPFEDHAKTKYFKIIESTAASTMEEIKKQSTTGS